MLCIIVLDLIYKVFFEVQALRTMLNVLAQQFPNNDD